MWDTNTNDPRKNVSFGGIRYIQPNEIPNNNAAPSSMDYQNNYPKGPPIANYYTPLPIPANYQPMADAAMTYGSVLADHGKQVVGQKIEKWMSLSRLKYYFAVDSKYVGKKLAIILFPYLHKDWSLQYDQENQPIAPRFDVNAPDLYIPVMAFVTFILISGWILGLQKRFSPEQLGIQASSCLMWEVIEVLITTISLYILNIGSLLRVFDIVAFTAYKYIGIIICLLIGMFLGTNAYYIALAYFGISIGYFLIRTLRLIILPNAYTSTIVNQNPNDPYSFHNTQLLNNQNTNQKRKTTSILLLCLCFLIQPILMAILTYHLLPSTNANTTTFGKLASKQPSWDLFGFKAKKMKFL